MQGKDIKVGELYAVRGYARPFTPTSPAVGSQIPGTIAPDESHPPYPLTLNTRNVLMPWEQHMQEREANAAREAEAKQRRNRQHGETKALVARLIDAGVPHTGVSASGIFSYKIEILGSGYEALDDLVTDALAWRAEMNQR
jgi:hypothetical protein